MSSFPTNQKQLCEWVNTIAYDHYSKNHRHGIFARASCSYNCTIKDENSVNLAIKFSTNSGGTSITNYVVNKETVKADDWTKVRAKIDKVAGPKVSAIFSIYYGAYK